MTPALLTCTFMYVSRACSMGRSLSEPHVQSVTESGCFTDSEAHPSREGCPTTSSVQALGEGGSAATHPPPLPGQRTAVEGTGAEGMGAGGTWDRSRARSVLGIRVGGTNLYHFRPCGLTGRRRRRRQPTRRGQVGRQEEGRWAS